MNRVMLHWIYVEQCKNTVYFLHKIWKRIKTQLEKNPHIETNKWWQVF